MTLSLASHFITPAYGQGCFADLPPLIPSFFGGQPPTLPAWQRLAEGRLLGRYQKVILIFVDGFGWRFFKQYADHPVFKRFHDQGIVTRWTSQFPSTTAAHVTAIHSGLTPGQSGIYEWQLYEPTLDAVIEPLTFSFAGDRQRDTLQSTGLTPSLLYPSQTIYPSLQQQGVKSYLLQHRDYTPSTYTTYITRGAKAIPHQSLAEALVTLSSIVAKNVEPTYLLLYFDRVDALCHKYGPDAPHVEAEIKLLLFALEDGLARLASAVHDDTLLLITADHGMMRMNPKTTRYLNIDEEFRGLERFLATDRRGKLLPPSGSPRDVFLRIQPPFLAEAEHFLRDRLAGYADVVQTQLLIDAGYFGPPPFSPRFLERVGNLTILSYPGEGIWWYERDRFDQRMLGHHGGLTREEMEIPLLACTIG